ncbi:DUF4912 domain-containing protein [bacterium]|nr:DUF4912 domain-containing protein [bacterium]
MDKLQSNSGQYPHSASLTIIEGDPARLAPGPGGPPPFGPVDLPRHYGLGLFEFLVVDPDFVFVSWELSEQQLAEARTSIGEEQWPQRRLVLRLLDAAQQQECARRELYGESGRWFVEAARPGAWLLAELGFEHGAGWHLLGSAGPLLLPRISPVDGEFRELHVSYGAAPDGHLTRLDVSDEKHMSATSIAALALNSSLSEWPGAGSGAGHWPASSGVWSRRQ